MLISRRRYEREINKSYLDGFNHGYKSGKAEGRMEHITPNMIRETAGLKPINKEEKED